ncbi:MAG: hypothetical protein OXG53_06350 [Chloroflexi bacterium]|nr:hypothetical protein [Chloroflexota bacterium]
MDSNCSLADAIQAAESDSAIGGCPAGDGADTIHLTGDITLAAELPQITSDITIEGSGFIINGDNSFRIFHIVDGTLAINQLTLSDGSAEKGGAIYNEGALNITNSRFANNTAEHFGGAIMNPGKLNITDTKFDRNRADLDGGAIASDGTLVITNSSFSNNSTESTSGGAIANYGPAMITSSSFSGNTASSSGGAISNINNTMTIVDSKFVNNAAEDYSGGAIFNGSGQLSVSECRFENNSSADSGGAIDNHTPYKGRLAHVSVTNSIFVGNKTRKSGGAIINSGEADIIGSSFEANLARMFGGAIANYGPLTVSNSTLSGNIGIEHGGGFHSFGDATANLQHLTLANNLSKEGGGISVYRQELVGTVVNLSNSLLFGNDGGDCNAQLNVNSGNLIADGSCDPAVSGDPLLGALVESEDGSPAYHPLLPGSPAIDAADSEYCAATDQKGAARPQGDGCDIGAIEFTPE